MSNMPQGWGLPNQTEKEIFDSEKRAFLQLVESQPHRTIRNAAKEPKNQALFDKVKRLQQEDGIDDGFSFIHLEKAIFGDHLKYKPQLIGSCVASGSRIVDTQRMLAEVFIFNQAQDLLGNKFQGPESFQPFAPFNYRLGRAYVNLNGGRANGQDDGSLCSTHIRGKMDVGFLPCNTKGLDRHTDFFPEPQVMATYRRWGADNTLVNIYKDQVIARQTETEKITNGNDLKTVIVSHLKPLMICSMWAFEATNTRIGNWTHKGSPVVLYRRSRQQWAHNMSLNAVVTVGGKDYVIVQNTWGDTIHSGRSWFPITLEEADRWLRNAEAMTIGDIEFFEPKTPAII